MSVIAHFKRLPQRFETSQAKGFEWIVKAHTQAETVAKQLSLEEAKHFAGELQERLMKGGCKPGIINKRGHALQDFLHNDWKAMEIYRLDEGADGAGLETRQKVHRREALKAMQKFYADVESPPQNIVHVSCTGYSSPSAAQEVCSRKLWSQETTVTHLYHMGCYAAIPAIRLAQHMPSADVVHTELTTLHMHPYKHEMSQLVSQSLFGDGFIKYSLIPEQEAKNPYLKIVAIREELIPDSLAAMEWTISDVGFLFVLAKEIPVLIMRHVEDYLTRLGKHTDLAKALFAIHPGGPKILDYIQERLKLSNQQLEKSRSILRDYGNMSSATLPHIWQDIVEDEKIPSGTKIVSLAFGPGLTIAGAILEKRGS